MVVKTMSTLVRLAAVLATAFVGLSFLLFAIDQTEEGSANQVNTIDAQGVRAESEAAIDRPAPDATTERLREARHSGVRELIDDGNDVVVTPFADVADSSNVWVERIVTGGLAALVFGLGGMLLANFLPAHRRQATDWREATS